MLFPYIIIKCGTDLVLSILILSIILSKLFFGRYIVLIITLSFLKGETNEL